MGSPSDELLRLGIDLFPDAQVRGTARAIVGRVRLALMFRQFEDGGAPTIGPEACCVVDREA
jgi:hypothetical protein